jgi:hypothetical protein
MAADIFGWSGKILDVDGYNGCLKLRSGMAFVY